MDGKAWIVSARTSTFSLALIARTHSWIAAEASGTAMAAPTSSRLARSIDDRDVAELGLDRVALGRRREVRDELEGVDARLVRLLEGQADEGQLGIGVGGPGEGPVVGRDRVTEGHPDRPLALVVGLMGVQLGSGRITDQEQPGARSAGDRHGAARSRLATSIPTCSRPSSIEREGPPDGEQDGVTGRAAAVVELDHVRAVRPSRRPGPYGPDAKADVHAVTRAGRAGRPPSCAG